MLKEGVGASRLHPHRRRILTTVYFWLKVTRLELRRHTWLRTGLRHERGGIHSPFASRRGRCLHDPAVYEVRSIPAARPVGKKNLSKKFTIYGCLS